MSPHCIFGLRHSYVIWFSAFDLRPFALPRAGRKRTWFRSQQVVNGMDAMRRWNRWSLLCVGVGLFLLAAGCQTGPRTWFARKEKPRRDTIAAKRGTPRRDFDRRLKTGSVRRFRIASAAGDLDDGGKRKLSTAQKRSILFGRRLLARRSSPPETRDPFLDLSRQRPQTRTVPARPGRSADTVQISTGGTTAKPVSHSAPRKAPVVATEEVVPSLDDPANRFVQGFDKEFERLRASAAKKRPSAKAPSFPVAGRQPQPSTQSVDPPPSRPLSPSQARQDSRRLAMTQEAAADAENPFEKYQQRHVAKTRAVAVRERVPEGRPTANDPELDRAEAVRRALQSPQAAVIDDDRRSIALSRNAEPPGPEKPSAPLVIPRGTSVNQGDPSLVVDSDLVPKDRAVFPRSGSDISSVRRSRATADGDIRILPRTTASSTDWRHEESRNSVAGNPSDDGSNVWRATRRRSSSAGRVNPAVLVEPKTDDDGGPSEQAPAVLPAPADSSRRFDAKNFPDPGPLRDEDPPVSTAIGVDTGPRPPRDESRVPSLLVALGVACVVATIGVRRRKRLVGRFSRQSDAAAF